MADDALHVQLRADSEYLIDMLRKGVADMRHTVEASRDAIRASREVLERKSVTASLPPSASEPSA